MPIEIPTGPGGARRGRQPDPDDPCFMCEAIAGQEAPLFHMHMVLRRREGSNWGSGPPHIAVLEGKEPVKPTRPHRITLEQEHQIAEEIGRWI